MSKVDDIKNQLAQRLEKQAAKPGASTARSQRIPKSLVGTSKNNGDKSSGELPSGHSQGVVKLSVSLYNFDIDQIDKIKDFMRKHGVRNLSDSEALRLACRAAPVGDEFLGIYEAMLTEDQRRKKAQKPSSAPAIRR